MSTLHTDSDGRLVRIVDRNGHEWATLRWDRHGLESLVVPGATLQGAIIQDPLLGDAHNLVCDLAQSPARGLAEPRSVKLLTTVSAIDWARPTEIPAIAAPGKLPPGAGSAILNVLAILAQRAGVPALRYAGPYPTRALWRSLARSFRTTASEAELSADLEGRMVRLARDPIPIDFVPAPHERVAHPHGHCELRDGPERALIDGVTYDVDPAAGSPARMQEGHAEVWFGDAPYARIATFDREGSLVAGPDPIPPCTSDVIGAPFPPALVAALAMLVAELVPGPLAHDTRAWIAAHPIEWADLGGRAAQVMPDSSGNGGILVHAAMWQRIGPLGLGRLALALAEALAPVVTLAILAEANAPMILPALR